MQCYAEEIPYMRYFLTHPDLTETQKKIIREKCIIPGEKSHFLNATEGVAKIRQGMNAFYAEETKIYNLIEETFFEHEKCGLVKLRFIEHPLAFLGFKKHSPYKELLRVK